MPYGANEALKTTNQEIAKKQKIHRAKKNHWQNFWKISERNHLFGCGSKFADNFRLM